MGCDDGSISYVRSRGIVIGSIASVIVPMGVILPRGVMIIQSRYGMRRREH
jgi:hypothetical protein